MGDTLSFGPFELDVEAFTLRRQGTQVLLEKIPMEVLIVLAQHAGALVDRDSIHAALWGADVFVDRDAAINTAMLKVRRALRDNADRPQFVETIVGKGYRFVAPVSARGAPGQRPRYCVMRGTHMFTLGTGDNLLGRDPAAEVRIDHPSVSRRHARIAISSRRAVLEDLKSRNGTFVNCRGITSPIELHDGAVIGVGPIILTFVALSGAASTRPMAGSSSPPDGDSRTRP
jgi:DNA-binding winged helix-turn-helix (wHTH) protein